MEKLKNLLPIFGLILNFIGSILIAFSFGATNSGMSLGSFETGQQVSVAYQSQVGFMIFQIGIILLIFGFALQLLSVVMKSKSFLHWTPRILSLLFALFILIISGVIISKLVEAEISLFFIFMKFVFPSILPIFLICLSWKNEFLGTFLYTGFGIYFMLWSLMLVPFSLWIYALISGSFFLIASLFFTQFLTKRFSNAN